MRFAQEIRAALGTETGESVSFTVDGGGGYFQNIKSISEFSSSAIVFRGRKGSVRVEGRELSLGKYYGGDAAVRGEIFKVERL